MRIINGHVWSMDGNNYECGYVSVDGGKIIGLGDINDITPDAADIDAEGGYILPGFVDPHCHIAVGDGDNELSDPVTPHISVLDAINPFDPDIKDAWDGGVTSAITCQGSGNVFGGTTAAIKLLYGANVRDMVVKAPCSLKMAFGENPKRVYGEMKKRGPYTRMGIAAIARDVFSSAAQYAKLKEQGNEPEYDAIYEAVIPALKGDIPLHCHAHRHDDALSAVRIACEFGMRIVLLHASGCAPISDILGIEQVPVAAGPFLFRSCKPEMMGTSAANPRILFENGVFFGICTDYFAMKLEHLRLCASVACREGLPLEEALKTITINAATLGDIQGRVGSLKVGKDADIVVWDQMPLEFLARPKRVYINGRQVR